jgi:hypothetical protein
MIPRYRVDERVHMEVRLVGASLPDDVFSTVGSRMAMRKGSVSQPIQHILQPSRPPFADSSQDRHFISYHRRLPEGNITVSHLHDALAPIL